MVVFLASGSVEAQTVTLNGRVSETVALSIPPHSTHGNIVIDAVSSGGTVQLTLSGKGANSGVIRVPLLVRSNSKFRIEGSFESTTAQLTQLSVIDVRATGRLVSPEAINNLEIQKQFDISDPFVVVSGPRVSLGGTLQSPNNALQITLLIRLKSDSVGGWLAHLTFSNN